MSDLILSMIAGAVAGVAACVLLLRFNLVPARRDATAAPVPLQPTEPHPAPDTTAPSDQSANITTLLSGLGRSLTPLADEASHPGQLTDMPEFQGVLRAFRRPDATTALLGQYALGDNWPLACAALTVAAERDDRHLLGDPVLRHLPNLRPFVFLYALRFLAALEQRPRPGTVMLATQQWWQHNPAVTDAFQEYFARSLGLGDPPDFGDAIDRQPEFDKEAIIGLLQKIHHPFAAQLLEALRRWEGTRIDRTMLRTIGTLWDPADDDPLLVLPDAWQPLLNIADAAVRQSRPRSILVTGDPRVGKTAFVELLGARLQKQGWTLFEAGSNELMADQAYIGQLEGRVRKLVEALHVRRKLAWYVGDLAHLAGSGTHQGQAASLLDQVLPAIDAGNLVVIAESSNAAAARLFQTRPSLRSLMEVVPLQPMDDAATFSLARQVARRITRNGIEVPDPVVDTAMDLARHYLGNDQLPGSVLELLKRATDRSRISGQAAVTADDVVVTLSRISGLPAVILDTSQRVDLGEVRKFFAGRVIGQDEAVAAIVDRIAMLKAGLTDPGKPIGVFLFAGPTGTGKTELAKTTAEFLFGAAERLVRLDMSEFQAVESTSKILGHRDGGGDSLIDRIRKQPFSVVLLDEFEKAHPNCWDLFLQIFDDGRLSDATGHEADFRHCIIILTSNLGATLHRGGGLGFRPDPGRFAAEQVLRTVGETFRPEFVNRLDKVIVFRPLSRELMRGILHKELAGVLERRGLRERAWAVEWEASAIEFLLDRGFSQEMGARPLKRAIDQLLLAPLAATLVEHRFPKGDQFLFVRSNGNDIEVEFVDPDAEPAATAMPDDASASADEVGNGAPLPAIILRQTGSAGERMVLARTWREIGNRLASETWRTRVDQLRLALADSAIWSRDDRHRVFSRIELADRIAEAARTADRLFRRYEEASGHTARASRELAGRLASHLYSLQQGMQDFDDDVPVDALLCVEPALEMGVAGSDSVAWCQRLASMYRQWSTKRRMQVREVGAGADTPILLITGFGAFRTLKAEAGLHVLEDEQRPDGARRIVARVSTVGGPEQDLPQAGAHAAAARILASGAAATGIVRRYREGPSPLVRDLVGGWRTGRISTVLGGDFDVLGAAKRSSAAEQ